MSDPPASLSSTEDSDSRSSSSAGPVWQRASRTCKNCVGKCPLVAYSANRRRLSHASAWSVCSMYMSPTAAVSRRPSMLRRVVSSVAMRGSTMLVSLRNSRAPQPGQVTSLARMSSAFAGNHASVPLWLMKSRAALTDRSTSNCSPHFWQ